MDGDYHARLHIACLSWIYLGDTHTVCNIEVELKLRTEINGIDHLNARHVSIGCCHPELNIARAHGDDHGHADWDLSVGSIRNSEDAYGRLDYDRAAIAPPNPPPYPRGAS